ncbi:MAG: hypothetical protein M3441_12480 [Chloroflexota bacterium]|nr:hypothetical protein [Chloroflexota bacterium]
MLGFVINRRDEEDYPIFDLPYSQWPNVLRPNTVPATILDESQTANQVIEVYGYRISLVDEMAGLQIEVESDDMPDELARKVVAEIHSNIEQATGHTYDLFELPPDKPVRFM